MKLYKVTGDSEPEKYSGCFRITEDSGISGKTSGSEFMYYLDSDISKYLKIEAFADSNCTKLLVQETILVINDGADGVGITTTGTEFAVSDSGTAIPTSG